MAGTLPEQLAHLAEHLEQLDHLPCSGILKAVALARQAEANAIRITPAMQKVLTAITAHPNGVTRYDLEAILKQRYSAFRTHVHELMKAKRVKSTPQGGRQSTPPKIETRKGSTMNLRTLQARRQKFQAAATSAPPRAARSGPARASAKSATPSGTPVEVPHA